VRSDRLAYHLTLSAAAMAVVLVVLISCVPGEDLRLPANARSARYLDPRLFAADIGEYKGTNIILHAKTLKVDHLDRAPGPYSWIYAAAEVRDSEADVPVVIEISDNQLQKVDIALRVDECYRFYAYVGSDQTVIDNATGAERMLPTLNGYYFKALASDGFEGCESP
jgi:hypothetical protein